VKATVATDWQPEHATPCCGASWWLPKGRAHLIENWVCQNCHRPIDISHNSRLRNGVSEEAYGTRDWEPGTREKCANCRKPIRALPVGPPDPVSGRVPMQMWEHARTGSVYCGRWLWSTASSSVVLMAEPFEGYYR